MALTNARDILNKKILGNGTSGSVDASDVSIDIEGLTSTKLDDGLEEIVGDISDVTTSVSTLDGKVDNLEDAINYSSSELVVGKWIDDSDIYRKMIK